MPYLEIQIQLRLEVKYSTRRGPADMRNAGVCLRMGFWMVEMVNPLFLSPKLKA